MSHFSVTVRVPNDAGDVHAAVARALAPFEETSDKNNGFASFLDEEDEHRKDYETGSQDMIRCPDGDLLLPWDERFRVPGQMGIGTHTHRVPDGAGYEEVQVPHAERFATYDLFMAGHCRNPNAKWDWWVVGGRWSGFYPVWPNVRRVTGDARFAGTTSGRGGSDIVRVADIDFDAVARIEGEKFDEFRREWRDFIAGNTFDAFDGPRDMALRIGLLRVEQNPDSAIGDGEIQVGKPWGDVLKHHAGTNRAGWRDVARVLDDAGLEAYRVAFNPLRTFAALLDDGWHAPGKMGWFGCSSDEPEDFLAWCRSFNERVIRSSQPTDRLVIVDCHI